MVSRIAPGGASTICLGIDDDGAHSGLDCSSNSFASGTNQNSGNCLTERTSTKVRQGPGGVSTICLGYDCDADLLPVAPSGRQQPGGNSTLILDHDETPTKQDVCQSRLSEISHAAGAHQFSGMATQSMLSLGIVDETPETQERQSNVVRQAPGGNSTLCLGIDDFAQPCMSTEPRMCPGGESTVCLRFDEEVPPQVLVSGRCPPGGESTFAFCADIVDDAGEGRKVSNRQAPGGTSTVCLGMEDCGELEYENIENRKRNPPGGETTICLGTEWSEDIFPSSESRIPPGGKSSLCFGMEDCEEQLPCQAGLRQPPGGAATFELGMVLTYETAHQMRGEVGGKDSVMLGGGRFAVVEASGRHPPGGHTTICLGLQEQSADIGDVIGTPRKQIAETMDLSLTPSKL